tara:strand:- start:277 stop:966 length:690 start_codon:yes stop_codon:yes gene_type:complete
MKELLNKFSFKSDLLFKELSKMEMRYFLDICEDLSFKKGNVLFYEGGIPTGVYFIQSGLAKKYTTGLEGKEQVVYVYKKMDLFGYHALLCNERYQDSCEALTDLEVKFISKDQFLLLQKKIPSFQNSIIRNISHEFGVLANTVALIAQKSLINRLIIFLLILNDRFDYNGINISRQDLANLVGATKESLGRSLKELRNNGQIKIQKRIICIPNKEDLYNVVLRQNISEL